MAVSIASEDRLKTFNEIVYSNASIQKLIDSLNLDSGVRPGKEMEDLIKTIKKNIETERPGSATFKISFTDTDPLRAQRGALLLAHHFIAEILKVENQRNELAVQFFEKKLDEFRDKFESQQKEMVNLLRTRVQESPVENKTLISNVEEVDKDVAETEQKVKDYERGLSLIQQVSSGLSTEGDKQALFDLDRMDLPQIAQLHPLVTKYAEISRRYTARYPEMQKLITQINDLLGVMKNALQQELAHQDKARADLEKRRIQIVDNLKQTTASQQIDKDKQSNFDILRTMYDEMQVKLEQARTSRDLGRTGSEQFVLLDPPQVPVEPTKPNRVMIITAGVGSGLLIGLFSAALSELLDPSIRSIRDISSYGKRVIAYLPESTA
jgi:uncharacterized protein involved in exopolysaccharide biosynthesis